MGDCRVGGDHGGQVLIAIINDSREHMEFQLLSGAGGVDEIAKTVKQQIGILP